MIDAVLLFGLMNIVFEFVLITMIPIRLRLRVLGNSGLRNGLHVFFLLCNLIIHWGTLIGTMSGILAFITSMLTVRVAMLLYGSITDGRYYTRGLMQYRLEDLA